MKKVLVLGGNGYIGSYLVNFLKDLGIEITVYGSRNNDYNKLTKDFFKPFTTVILLAGQSSVQMCVGDLASPWNNNVRNFNNLVQKLDFDQELIYASSSSVYGNKGGKIFTEEDLNLEYINNYDLTKVSLDLLALNYIKQGRRIIGLRFGTVNGASNVIRRDLMLNSMIYSALFKGVITVNNKHVNRPILSVNDLSRSIFKILTSRFISGIYNLASFNSNVEEMSVIVRNKTGVGINDIGDKPGIYDFETSTDKFSNTFNFVFLSTVDSIINDIIKCYSDNKTQIVIRNEYFKYD